MCLWKIIDTFQKQNIYKTIDIFFLHTSARSEVVLKKDRHCNGKVQFRLKKFRNKSLLHMEIFRIDNSYPPLHRPILYSYLNTAASLIARIDFKADLVGVVSPIFSAHQRTHKD